MIRLHNARCQLPRQTSRHKGLLPLVNASCFRETDRSEVASTFCIITWGNGPPFDQANPFSQPALRLQRPIPVKPTLAENSHSPVETAPNTTAAPSLHVTVYTFVVWDHDKGATAIYPRMATREAIAKMRGKVNEDTAWVVDASAIDIEGFYSGVRQDGR